MFGVPTSAFLICLMAGLGPAMAQTPAQRPPDRQAPAKASSGARPPDPTRDPKTPGYVKAKELPDGTIPSPEEDGNFIIGPTHNAAPEMAANEGVPKGDVYEFTMESKDSKIYTVEAVQHRGLGVFKVGQAQDGLGTGMCFFGTWLLLHDRWPPCHRSMIRVVPRLSGESCPSSSRDRQTMRHIVTTV